MKYQTNYCFEFLLKLLYHNVEEKVDKRICIEHNKMLKYNVSNPIDENKVSTCKKIINSTWAIKLKIAIGDMKYQGK